MDNGIIIRPNYIFWDYFKINFYILVNKLSYYIIIPFSFIFISLDIYYINTGQKKAIELIEFPSIVFLLLPFIIFLSVYRITKHSLSNKKLKEDIKIIINSQYVDYQGETFNIKYSWADFLKLKETKNWFLFYVNKKQAQVIRKKDLNDEQLVYVQQILAIVKK